MTSKPPKWAYMADIGFLFYGIIQKTLTKTLITTVFHVISQQKKVLFKTI